MNISERISMQLFMNKQELLSFALSSPHRYKVYKIPKRNSSKFRTIAHPSKELKFIQRLLINELSGKLNIHPSSTAYKKGCSIKNNAEVHANTKYLLKMDLKDFFPSITPHRFFEECRIQKVEFTKLDTEILTGFLFWKPRRAKKLILSIGAPSSPLISNFILFRLDEFILNYCNGLGINYTRYADDLTFSTDRKEVLFRLPQQIKKALKSLYNNEIKINSLKTIFSSKAHNRHVTGVTLSNDGKISIGREAKRNISVKIHHFSQNLLEADAVFQLKGHFSHATFIEPLFKIQMINKYGFKVIEKLIMYGK